MNKLLDRKPWTSALKKYLSSTEDDKKFRPLHKIFFKALGGKTKKYYADIRMSNIKDDFNKTQSIQDLFEKKNEGNQVDLYPVDFEENLYETIPSRPESSIIIDNTNPRFSGIYALGSDNYINDFVTNSNTELPSSSSSSSDFEGPESEVFVGSDDDEIKVIEIIEPEETKEESLPDRGNLVVTPKRKSVSCQKEFQEAVRLDRLNQKVSNSSSSNFEEPESEVFVGSDDDGIEVIEIIEPEEVKEKSFANRENLVVTPKRKSVPCPKQFQEAVRSDRLSQNVSKIAVRTPIKRNISVFEGLNTDTPIKNRIDVSKISMVNPTNNSVVSPSIKSRFEVVKTPKLLDTPKKRNVDGRTSISDGRITSTPIRKNIEVVKSSRLKCSSPEVNRSPNKKTVEVLKTSRGEEIKLKRKFFDSATEFTTKRNVPGVKAKEEVKVKLDLPSKKIEEESNLKRVSSIKRKTIDLSPEKCKDEDRKVEGKSSTEEVEAKLVLPLKKMKEERTLKRVSSIKRKTFDLNPEKCKDEDRKDEGESLSFRAKIRMFEPNYKKEKLAEKQKKEEKLRVLNKHKAECASSSEEMKKDRHKGCVESSYYATENTLSFFDLRAKPIVVSPKSNEKLFIKKQTDTWKSKSESASRYQNLAKIGARHASGCAKIEESPKYCNHEPKKVKTSLGHIPKWNLQQSESPNAKIPKLNQEELIYKKCVHLSPIEVEFLKKQKEISHRNAAVNDIIESSMSDSSKILELVKSGAENANNRSLTYPTRLETKKLSKDLFAVQQCKSNLTPNRLPITDLDDISPVSEKIALFEAPPTPTYTNTNNLFLDEFGEPISPVVKENIQRAEDRFVVNIFESRLAKRRQQQPKPRPDNAKIIRIGDNTKCDAQLVTKIQDANISADKIPTNNSIAKRQRKFENSPPLLEIYNRMEYNEVQGLGAINDNELTPEINGEEPIYATPNKTWKSSSLGGDSNNNCETFLKLKQEVDIQGKVMKQASKALECCKGSSADIASFIEAEKILLAASCKYESLMKEIRRDHNNRQGNVGTVEINSIRLALKQGNELEWYVVILSHEDKVFSSKVVEASPNQQEIYFTDLFVFENLNASFKIKISVYSLQDRRKLKESKFRFNKKVTTLCGKSRKLRFKDLQTSTLVESNCSTSSFQPLGSLEITVKDITTRETFTLENIPATSSLAGPIMLSARVADVKLQTSRSGFLNIGVEKNEGLVWNRRWCVLSGTKLQLWNYPNEEDVKAAEEVMDLIHCTGSIRAAERSQCPKQKSLKLGTLNENCERENVHYLNADTTADFNIWRLELNNVFDTLEDWKVLDNMRSTCL